MEVENLSFKATAKVSRLNLLKTDFQTGRKVIYIAPTQSQAKKIVWEALKSKLKPVAVKMNEASLEMHVKNEDGLVTIIYVGGWENRENYRGLTDVVHITVDEVDTLRNFFVSWKEIFRPMFLDTGGSANFIGTPDNKSRNLLRLEKQCETNINWRKFKFTSHDNPFLPKAELESLEQEYDGDRNSYKQEVLAEYIDDAGALFRYSSIVDTFTNTVTKGSKYLIVDVADDGSDKSVFSYWEGLEEYRRDEYQGLNTEAHIEKIREMAGLEQIPYSHIAVDAIGVGAGIASSSLLAGVIGYKSSYAPIKTDQNIVVLPNQGVVDEHKLTSDYKNLRSQCVFTLAEMVNNHKIASRVDGQFKEYIIEELQAYQDASKGDGKRFATPKEDVSAMIGRSPDHSDTWLMRMYFVVRDRMRPNETENDSERRDRMMRQMAANRGRQAANGTR